MMSNNLLMVEQSADIKNLVSQLESHLNSAETKVKQSLRITQQTLDEHLDDLFLTPTFERQALIAHIPILRPTLSTSMGQPANDIEVIET
jgi:hypothetical protein